MDYEQLRIIIQILTTNNVPLYIIRNLYMTCKYVYKHMQTIVLEKYSFNLLLRTYIHFERSGDKLDVLNRFLCMCCDKKTYKNNYHSYTCLCLDCHRNNYKQCFRCGRFHKNRYITDCRICSNDHCIWCFNRCKKKQNNRIGYMKRTHLI